MSQNLKADIKELPDDPGIYMFKDETGKILYIGKATSLKNRVKSYFAEDLVLRRGPKLVQMINNAKSIDYEGTASVLEALLLEARLIRKFQPPFNTDGKDDKSYNCIVITKEKYPRVLLTRESNLDEYPKNKRLYLIGPFPKGSSLKEAIKILRRIFPFRDTCVPELGKKCFNAQIGLCPGVCDSSVSETEYNEVIKKIILFLDGKKARVISELKKEMNNFAKRDEFELAIKARNKIRSLEHINDIALYKKSLKESSAGGTSYRIEAYDVAHISGSAMVGVMAVLEGGIPNKKEYRSFNIRSVKKSNDPKALMEMLTRRLKHQEWPYPNLVVVDGNVIQQNVAKKALEKISLQIDIVSVVKDSQHKPKAIIGEANVIDKEREAILLANAEAHRFSLKLHRNKRDRNFILQH